jgi:iron complex transport system substrate-binding protein
MSKIIVNRVLFVAALLLLAFLAACSGGAAEPPASSATIAPEAAATEPAAPAAPETDAGSSFPVTITHKYGTTTIPEAPQRVVSIGYTEQDPLLAVGVVPVAVRFWYGEAPFSIFPWAQEEAAGAEPVVMEMAWGELNYEAILELDPDLISGVVSGITQEEYDQLSLIAPTTAQSGEYIDFGMPWQEVTQMVGDSVGKSEEAAAKIAEVEAKFQQARDENPDFQGKTIAVAYSNGDGTYGFYTDQDGRARFFTDLGFVISEELVEIAGESFYANLSQERLDLLDADVLLFLGLQFLEGGRESIESDPLIQQLDAYKEGRLVFVPLDYDDALQFGTVLSLEYALEGLLPELQAAVNP